MGKKNHKALKIKKAQKKSQRKIKPCCKGTKDCHCDHYRLSSETIKVSLWQHIKNFISKYL